MSTSMQEHFDRLDADQLLATIREVRAKIDGDFHGRGLSRVAARLELVAQDVDRGARKVRRPYWEVRLLIALVMVGVGAAGSYLLGFSHFDPVAASDTLTLIQALDAVFNAVFLLLAGIVSIVSIEQRMKRSRALADLHRVRSLTHVIDMHQLSKDPVGRGEVTDAEHQNLLGYLSYCTDLLNLTGKIGALYAQDMQDLVIIETVNDIELLSSNLARKIWQKIQILRAEPISL